MLFGSLFVVRRGRALQKKHGARVVMFFLNGQFWFLIQPKSAGECWGVDCTVRHDSWLSRAERVACICACVLAMLVRAAPAIVGRRPSSWHNAPSHVRARAHRSLALVSSVFGQRRPCRAVQRAPLRMLRGGLHMHARRCPLYGSLVASKPPGS